MDVGEMIPEQHHEDLHVRKRLEFNTRYPNTSYQSSNLQNPAYKSSSLQENGTKMEGEKECRS
ncbi:hypothetical protein C5167_010047 [Papaver somniferum]|uniref:Uncharacterized protein n=1 Tax=Papaver somniferum TaxID=3469 RepID=A0A4Y7K211_PAPSO|nr:hypothetical protein C5167_010047 [Papaver somniferum]